MRIFCSTLVLNDGVNFGKIAKKDRESEKILGREKFHQVACSSTSECEQARGCEENVFASPFPLGAKKSSK